MFAKGAVPLVNTPWVLLSYGDPEAPTTVLPGVPITAQFAEDGIVSGSAGCNGYNAGFEVNGQEITITTVASTMMMCPVGMEQEAAYLAAFDVARSFEIFAQTLTITYDPDQCVTELQPHQAPCSIAKNKISKLTLQYVGGGCANCRALEAMAKQMLQDLRSVLKKWDTAGLSRWIRRTQDLLEAETGADLTPLILDSVDDAYLTVQQRLGWVDLTRSSTIHGCVSPSRPSAIWWRSSILC